MCIQYHHNPQLMRVDFTDVFKFVKSLNLFFKMLQVWSSPSEFKHMRKYL